MKNLYLNPSVTLAFIVISILTSTSDLKSQIVSSAAGGLWSSPSTWTGNIVPGPSDDVIITSTVSVNNNSCKNIHVQSGGVLNNYVSFNYWLTILGNLTNDGLITNNNFSLNLLLHGNLTNTGTISIATITYAGIGDQQISSSQPLSISNFIKNETNGRLIATSNLSLIGTNVNLGVDTLEFSTSASLVMDGGYLSNGVIYKSSMPALSIDFQNGTHIYSMVIDAMQSELHGVVTISASTNVFKNNILNYGTLQNLSNNSYTLQVNGSLINYGTIADNVFNLYIYIAGNLINHGNWQNEITVLNGAGDQQLTMSQPFSGTYLTRNSAIGRVKVTTSVSFTGTTITLNSDTLEFTTGYSITMNGGSINSGVLYKTSLPSLQMINNNGAYISDVTIDALHTELAGSLLISGNNNTLKKDINNYGELKNSPTNNYTLNIAGNFTNQGTVTSNYFSFNINIQGNLMNDGIWSNQTTTLNSISDQQISTSQPFSGLYLNKSATTGNLIAVGDLIFNNTIINLSSDTIEFTTGNGITLSGGNINSGILYKTSSPSLRITAGNGTYLNTISIYSPQTELFGVILIGGVNNNFNTQLINNGTLKNRPNNTYTLNVNGHLTNNGSIGNNIFNLNITISGDVTNNGTWRNYATTLNGSSLHNLLFTESFQGELLFNNNASGGIYALSDITFDGTNIDLNDCVLTVTEGGQLSVLNGCLINAIIDGDDLHFRSFGSYCNNVDFISDVTLHGVFQAGLNITFTGNIINEGFLRNRNNNNYSIIVQGDIHNNGSILNNAFYLTIVVLGNIYNNGIWSNQVTTMDGMADQYINIINDKPIQGQIRMDANFSGSTFTWWGPTGNLIGNPNFSGAHTQLLQFNNNPINNADTGQYYCINNQSVNSRSIFIESLIVPERTLSINVLLEGLYNGSGTMTPSLDKSGSAVWNETIADVITLSLHDPGNFNSIIHTFPDILLNINGSATISIPSTYTGDYFLAIKHRNSIQTVSSVPVSLSLPVITYNFDLPIKAYGDNLIMMPDGWYALFAGDVNQDDIIDSGDMIVIDNESASFSVGYTSDDLNGDGLTDSGDMIIVDNNSSSFVSAVLP